MCPDKKLPGDNKDKAALLAYAQAHTAHTACNTSHTPQVLVCPDKKLPGDNKDKAALLAYTTAVDAW